MAAALGALVLAGLSAGLVLGLGSSPTVHRPRSAGASDLPGSSTTLPPTTTTVPPTTTTTTTLPTGPTAALAALVHDVASGEAAGTVDPRNGQSISNQAEQSVNDETAGNPNQAANDLQQAATTLAHGLQNGKITQDEGTVLQADLSMLATALGLGATGSPSPDTQPVGNGQGNQNDH